MHRRPPSYCYFHFSNKYIQLQDLNGRFVSFSALFQNPCPLITPLTSFFLVGCHGHFWTKPARSLHKDTQTQPFVQRASPSKQSGWGLHYIWLPSHRSLQLYPSRPWGHGHLSTQHAFLAWVGNEPHLHHYAAKHQWSECKSAVSPLLSGLWTEL